MSARRPLERKATALEARLHSRRSELEQAAFARIVAISDPAQAPDPTYISGLRGALAAGLEYGCAAIAGSDREPAPVPVELLAQARLAARNRVSLDAVLRRYAAGHSLIAESLLDEAAALGFGPPELKTVMRKLATRYERIIAAVSAEYALESSPRFESHEQRRCRLLLRLLAGEPVDVAELGYEFDAHHLGIVASGTTVDSALASLRERLDRQILLAQPEDRLTWVWLGGRREFDCEELEQLAALRWPPETFIACGAPAQGLGGWRLTHRQACSALGIGRRRSRAITRYGDVALFTAVERDADLVAYLTDTFLAPLATGRGETLRNTLRAYFEVGRSVSSAASMLGVSRQTVTKRLRAVEERLGRSLTSCRAELEAALELAAFDSAEE